MSLPQQRRFAGALLTSVAIAACGARTGLPIEGVDGSGGAGGKSEPKACVPGTFDLSKAISTVMFVVDRSGSMGQRLTQQGNQSKWELLREGLAATLPSVDQQVEMGLLIFPAFASNLGDESCAAPGTASLLPALGHAAAIDSLLQSSSPGGLTPTASAIQNAANTLKGTRAASSARAIVLATDGGPNCNPNLDPDTCECIMGGNGCKQATNCLDSVHTTAVIAAVAADGIPTYVIGLGSDLQAQYGDTLNAMAVAGGRPKQGTSAYYAVTSPEDLSAALVDVRDQVSQCVYLSSSVPDADGTIQVDLDGTVIPQDASGKTGWSWVNQSNGELIFSSAACSLVSQAKDAPHVTITCGDAGTTSATTGSTSAMTGSSSKAASSSGASSSTASSAPGP